MPEEKITREIRVVVQPSLYKSFKTTCVKNYKSVSEIIREMMVRYIKENKERESEKV